MKWESRVFIRDELLTREQRLSSWWNHQLRAKSCGLLAWREVRRTLGFRIGWVKQKLRYIYIYNHYFSYLSWTKNSEEFRFVFMRETAGIFSQCSLLLYLDMRRRRIIPTTFWNFGCVSYTLYREKESNVDVLVSVKFIVFRFQ